MISRLLKSVAVSVTGLAVISSAGAQEVVLDATHIGAPQSSFSLAFPDFGLVTDAEIATTDLDLAIDSAAGTAHFDYYHQNVGSLVLPDGQGGFVETGPLVIEIAPGTSTGTYDADKKVFSTTDTYVIYFDGDLSAFGIFSPFILEGASSGTVVDDNGDFSIGTLEFNWVGDGSLGTPENPLNYTYSCDVNANYEDFQGCAGGDSCEPTDFDRDCSTGLSDMSILLSHYGYSDILVGPRFGDIDNDAKVTLTDLSIFLGSFGVNCN